MELSKPQERRLVFLAHLLSLDPGDATDRKRALRYAQSNYNFDYDQFKNRWTGEGSTNSYPSAAALIRSWNISDQRVNSFFVESANYFRIQNVTLGYTFKNIKMEDLF